MKPISIAAYFDILSQSQKLYGRQLEPICKKWALTRNELDVVLFLYNNPEYDRAADIVSRRGIAKSHVSLSVASLEAKGLLKKEYSQSDRRMAHLKLTSQGKAIAAEARQTQMQFFASLYAGITGEEMQLWQRLTETIGKNLEKLEKA